MKCLLLLLTTLSASAQLAITTFTIDHSEYGNLVLGWTNANPSYPMLILATPDLTQPSTNWTLLLSNSAPFSYGFAEWNYSTYYQYPNTYVGLHDLFYTVSTNYITGGTNMVITSSDPMNPDDPYATYTTNYVYQLASTNYTTNYNCFFKLYQPIPPPPPVLPPELNPADNAAALVTVISNPQYATDFFQGLGFGFTVSVGSMAISYLRTVIHGNNEEL